MRGILLQRFKRGYKLLKLRKRRGADLIAGRAIENQLDNAILCIARITSRLENSSCASFSGYSRSISAAKRATIASRFSLPFAVSMPFSMVSGSGTI